MVEFWNILESNIVYEQLRPVKPFEHLQVYVNLTDKQAPPFSHGDDQQSLRNLNVKMKFSK